MLKALTSITFFLLFFNPGAFAMDTPEISIQVKPQQNNIGYRVNDDYVRTFKTKIEKIANEAVAKIPEDVHNKMVTLKFLIHPAGELSNLRIVSSSEKHELDQLALKSLQSGSPFPKLLNCHEDPRGEPREVWFEATFKWL